MSVEIIRVENDDIKTKKKFVRFPIQLYKDNPYYVPPLVFEELDTLNPAKNPAFAMCEMQMFLAMRGQEIVGRICAIINHKANEVWNIKAGRFSFYDFIDDEEVVDALFNAAETWLKEKGMTSLVGPSGFSGLDHEGLLIEGFEHVTTMASKYNFDYYQKHIERIGFQKEVDAQEYLITVPEEVPERHLRIAEMVKKRYKLKVLKFKNMKEVKPYVVKLFNLLNKVYSPLYGFVPLSQEQIDYYVKMYVPILRWDLVTIVIEEETDEVVAFGITMPSLSRGLIKARGNLFPMGWYHILRDMKFNNPVMDLLLIGIDPEYQGKGVNAIIFTDIISRAYKLGFRYAESNPELEVNSKVNSLWEGFDAVQHKKRRFYKKNLY